MSSTLWGKSILRIKVPVSSWVRVQQQRGAVSPGCQRFGEISVSYREGRRQPFMDFELAYHSPSYFITRGLCSRRRTLALQELKYGRVALQRRRQRSTPSRSDSGQP